MTLKVIGMSDSDNYGTARAGYSRWCSLPASKVLAPRTPLPIWRMKPLHMRTKWIGALMSRDRLRARTH